jgi:hypothetical protein
MSEPGHALLDDVEAMLAKYVAFPDEHARAAIVLWIVHAHAVDAFESTPRLALLSPKKGSGKTRTLEVIALLVPHPIHTINISAAALYRIVKDKQPTLLLDEADTFLGLVIAKQHEDIRGLVNAGHRRGATVYRGEVAGKTVQVVEFPAFAACALAGIGDLPDTILNRSVIISMKRRAHHEHIDPFRERQARPEADRLRDRIAEWADAHHAHLGDYWPDLPEGITDRAADVWEALIAIADLAGGDWPERSRTAATAITNAKAERDPSLGIQLLGDCHRVFTADDVDRLTTDKLLDALHNLEESPWSDLRGKPLDARGLARRLRVYEIRPGNHRFGDAILKGYRLEDFHDALQRYLPHTVAPVADVVHIQENRETGPADQNDHSLLSADLLSIPDPASLSSVSNGQQALQPQQQALPANGNSATLEDELEVAARLAWLDERELEELDEHASESETP